MIYKWKSGSRHSVKADVAGKICEQLESEGRLTAKDLVDISRPEDAPLHKEFEWDDTVAAEKYREQQGRVLIAHIIVSGTENEPVRAFYNLTVEKAETYESIETIISSEDGKGRLLKQAISELQNFKVKYASLKKYLGGVFDEIDKVKTA